MPYPRSCGTRNKRIHEDYLTIFSQMMNLMPNTFLQANDVIQMTSSNYNSCDW